MLQLWEENVRRPWKARQQKWHFYSLLFLHLNVAVLNQSCNASFFWGKKGNIKYSSPAGPEITETGGFTSSEQRATGLPRFPKMGCRNVQSHLKIMPTGFPIGNLQPASQCAHKHCIMTFYFKNISTSNFKKKKRYGRQFSWRGPTEHRSPSGPLEW